MSDEFEEIEQIPWSALAAKTPDPLPRLAAAAAGIVAVIVLGVLVSRVIGGGEPAAVVTLPPAPLATPVATETLPAEPAAVAPAPTAAPLSEADLMAVAIDDEERLATMHAEWLVRDYFTVDGDDTVSRRLRKLLGNLATPHQSPGGSSYVEWARAFMVDTPEPGRYTVDVAYQTLALTGEGRYTRSPARAVAVTLDVDVDGTARLVDLPTPVEIPATTAMEVDTSSPVDPPDEVVAEALRVAASAGIDPAVGEASRDGSGWRVVVEVGDGSGNRWPLVVAVKDL